MTEQERIMREIIPEKLREIEQREDVRILHGSNPTLFEWDSSPVVYRATPE